MMREFINKLGEAPDDPERLVAYLEQALEELGQASDPPRLFPHVFRFFETHPEADLGMPGPLVHWLEQYFPDYLDELDASLERQPTYHTAWMVSRILRAEIDEDLRKRMVRALSQVIQHPDADDLCVETARQFLSLHLEQATQRSST